VSTRKVDDLVGALGVASGISKSEVSRICADLDGDLEAFRNRTLGHVEFPYELRAQLGAGTVGARLRRLARLQAEGELVEWLREMLDDLLKWEKRVAELEERLSDLLDLCGSTLTEEVGIGAVSAAELVAQVGDPSRFGSEAAFARWAGVVPVATSSGEGDGEPARHRLDLLGNRTVNRILHVMSVTQARHHDPGKVFLARKRSEGKTGKEARRAHKRQLANRVIRRMWADHRRLMRPSGQRIAPAA
jgi:transposase